MIILYDPNVNSGNPIVIKGHIQSIAHKRLVDISPAESNFNSTNTDDFDIVPPDIAGLENPIYTIVAEIDWNNSYTQDITWYDASCNASSITADVLDYTKLLEFIRNSSNQTRLKLCVGSGQTQIPQLDGTLPCQGIPVTLISSNAQPYANSEKEHMWRVTLVFREIKQE